MDDINLADAKAHLEDLIQRAQRGEDVRISDPRLGTVQLRPLSVADSSPKARPKRRPGRWKDRLPPPPEGFFDPLTGDELKDWYGNDP